MSLSIQNCRISKAEVDLLMPESRITVNLETISQKGEWSHKFDWVEGNRYPEWVVKSIMNFTKVEKVSLLVNQVLREITNENEVIGLGDPIQDVFILLDQGRTEYEYSEQEILELFSKPN